MWPFRSARHLKYDSIRAWIVGENIPTPITSIPDAALQDRCLRQYGELRRHLFDKHLRTLPAEKRRQFKRGRHPSQSHAFADRAEPFARQLQEHLASMGFPCRVEPGAYHGDRIVLTAELPADPGAWADRLPWLFEGFEVKYAWPEPPPPED